MSRWGVSLTVYATVYVEVEADTEEKAKQIALDMAEYPTICHQCAKCRGDAVAVKLEEKND